jgi:hypothetical protein
MIEDKKPFLVAYDYGMGGLWGVVDARSEGELHAKFPELAIVDERPSWMTQERYDEILRREHHDIDEDDPRGLLRAVVADRGRH